jgi:hypothetical protein
LWEQRRIIKRAIILYLIAHVALWALAAIYPAPIVWGVHVKHFYFLHSPAGGSIPTKPGIFQPVGLLLERVP